MDIVYIRGLQVDTVIGIYDWERTIRQTRSEEHILFSREILKVLMQPHRPVP